MDVASSGTNTRGELIREFLYDDDDQADGLVGGVSKAVAEVTDTPLEELPPLQETVDCDALESLFDSFSVGHGIAQVQFPLNGCTVRIDSTGTIQVYHSKDQFSPAGSGC
jgi:hypothetical protein